MPADVRGRVRLHDHRHRVPAHEALEADFSLPIAGILGLLRNGNGVAVRRVEAARQLVLRRAKLIGELFKELRRAFRALGFERELEDGLHRVRKFFTTGAVRVPAVVAWRARIVNFFFLSFHCVIQVGTELPGEIERLIAPRQERQIKPKTTARRQRN